MRISSHQAAKDALVNDINKEKNRKRQGSSRNYKNKNNAMNGVVSKVVHAF
jgi:hypothetical protein